MNLDKFREKGYSNITSLISAIFFFIIGSIIFTNPNGTVRFISYVLGGCFSIIGTFKISVYYYKKNKNKEIFIKDAIIGCSALVIGIILIVFSSTLVSLLIELISFSISFSDIIINCELIFSANNLENSLIFE